MLKSKLGIADAASRVTIAKEEDGSSSKRRWQYHAARILVYSDNPNVRTQVKLALGKRIYPELPELTYIDVATGPMVIKHVDAQNVDVAILDGEAVPVGGLGIAKQLKDEIADCPPIVVLIGRPDDAWLARWSRAEAVVRHPIDPIELTDEVVKLLDTHPAVEPEWPAFAGRLSRDTNAGRRDEVEIRRGPQAEVHTAGLDSNSVEPSIEEGHSMLNDASLKRLYTTLLPGKTLPTDVDGARSPVQPSSLDLSIGQIYVPDVKAGEPGAVRSPRTPPYFLKPGHTAVVTTRETLSVPDTHGAIGFPPTHISNNGILMTNPGHIDPGYHGPLTFTVINMGRENFELGREDRIVTILFFKLEGGKPDKHYTERNPPSVPARPPVDQARMDRLAPDMLNVDSRVKAITDSAEAQTRRLSIRVPLVLAIVVGAGTIFAPVVSNLVSQNADLQRRISVLEDRKNQDEVQNRLKQLEQQVSKMATPPTTGAPGGTR